MGLVAILGITVTPEMTAGEILVGAGTLLLAAFTAFLAFRTSREVQLTETGLALSRESIEALDRPFVITAPPEDHKAIRFANYHEGTDLPDDWRLYFRLWNLGRGPAMVERISFSGPENGGEKRELLIPMFGRIERAIAAEQGRDASIPLGENSPPSGDSDWLFRVEYRSPSGRLYMTRSNVRVFRDLQCICVDYRRGEVHDPRRPETL